MYRLIADTESYGMLEFELLAEHMGHELFLGFADSCDSWAPRWSLSEQPFEAEFYPLDNGTKPTILPDLSLWQNTGLVLSEKAVDTLGSSLRLLGELLPFQCEGKSYSLFRCTQSVNADMEKSSKLTEDGLDIEIRQLGFSASEVGTAAIFKTPYDSYRNLFCTLKFKQAIESKGLTGIYFDTDLVTNVF